MRVNLALDTSAFEQALAKASPDVLERVLAELSGDLQGPVLDFLLCNDVLTAPADGTDHCTKVLRLTGDLEGALASARGARERVHSHGEPSLVAEPGDSLP